MARKFSEVRRSDPDDPLVRFHRAVAEADAAVEQLRERAWVAAISDAVQRLKEATEGAAAALERIACGQHEPPRYVLEEWPQRFKSGAEAGDRLLSDNDD